MITIYVSKGGEDLTMPNLKGLSRLSAEDKLKKMGLTMGSVYEKVSDQEAWTVLEQEPAEGKKIAKGQSVELTISKGKQIKLVRVPDFSGGTQVLATTKVTATADHLLYARWKRTSSN